MKQNLLNRSISRLVLILFLVNLWGFVMVDSVGAADSSVVISEVAWMGTITSANDEWIELYNPTDKEIDLTGWRLTWQNRDRVVDLVGIIESGGVFLLERTDDDTVSDVTADQIYTGSLKNSGEYLILFDADGEIVDQIDNSGGWVAGDNESKQTMVLDDEMGWVSSIENGGTPGVVNFSEVDIDDIDIDPGEGDLGNLDLGESDSEDPDLENPDREEPVLSVTNFQILAQDSQVELSWEFPENLEGGGVIILQSLQPLDFKPQDGLAYEIGEKFENGYENGENENEDGCSSGEVIYVGPDSSLVVENLVNGVEYFFQIWVYNSQDNYSEGVEITFTPFSVSPVDITPPAEITDLISIVGDLEITLSWIPPSDEDFSSVRILRSTEDFPPDCFSGDLLFENNSATSFIDQNLQNDIEYFYRLCTYDEVSNYSEGMTISEQPFTQPEIIFSEVAWAGSNLSSVDEWIELHNLTDHDIDLTGWQIWDAVKGEVMLIFPDGMKVAAGDYFLVANYDSDADNSTLGIEPDWVENDISLSNSALELLLKNSFGEIIDRAGDGSAPSAGQSGDYKIAMQRAENLRAGDNDKAWEDAVVSQNFDLLTRDYGTPGLENKSNDDVSPARITDLQATQTKDGALLTFTPTLDDGGSGGLIESMEIRFYNEEITIDNWEMANTLGLIEGDKNSFPATGIEVGSWFAVQAIDDVGNISEVSNSVQLVADTKAPEIIFYPNPGEIVFTDTVLPFTVEIGSNENNAQINCSVIGKEIEDIESIDSAKIVLKNSSKIECSAIDLAGNESGIESINFNFVDLSEQIIFSEILPNPIGDDSDGEWIELYNRYLSPVSLSGWQIADESKTFIFPDNTRIGAGDYYFLPRQTSDITLQNSGSETLILKMPGEMTADIVTRTDSASENESYARDMEDEKWQWTTTLTPGLTNIFTQDSSGDNDFYYDSYAISANNVDIKITAVSFNDPGGDWAEFQCFDCAENGTDLGGWSIWDDGRIFHIPVGFTVRRGEIFRLEFKAVFASDFQNRILRTVDTGLTSTDEQLILKDSNGIIEDAVCWANRNGKWSPGENMDVAELITLGVWKSNQGLRFDEDICFDSSLAASKQAIKRLNIDKDTDTIFDWGLGQETTEIEIDNEIETKEEVTEIESDLPADIRSRESSIRISEVLPDPEGSDQDNEWIELENYGLESVDLVGFALRSGNSRFEFQEGQIKPGEFLLIPRSDFRFSLINKGDELILEDLSGNQIDQMKWGKAPRNQSWSLFDGDWQWTTSLTPGLPNFLIQPEDNKINRVDIDELYFDTDGDLIPDIFEEKLGLDLQGVDIDSEGLIKYQDYLLSQVKIINTLIMSAQTMDDNFQSQHSPFSKITGQAPPFTKVHLVIHSDIIEATTQADIDGFWEYIPDKTLEAGIHTIFAAIEDPNGVQTPARRIAQFELSQDYEPPAYSDQIRISEVFPNPKGGDTPEQEWLEIENYGDKEISLTDWVISDGKKEIQLGADIVIPPGFFVLRNDILNLSFYNSRAHFILKNPLGRTVFSFDYNDKIGSDESLIYDIQSGEIQKTIQVTPGDSNLIVQKNVQKNSSENPFYGDISEIRNLSWGKWVKISGRIIVPPNIIATDVLWISDGKKGIRVKGQDLPGFRIGQEVYVLGKISRTKDVDVQILISDKEAYIAITDSNLIEMSQNDFTVLDNFSTEYLDQIVSISGTIKERDRHFLTLENDNIIKTDKVNDFPLLEVGDWISATGLIVHDNRNYDQLVLQPWNLDQIEFKIMDQGFLEQVVAPRAVREKKNINLPIFGGLIAIFGAVLFSRRYLKEKLGIE